MPALEGATSFAFCIGLHSVVSFVGACINPHLHVLFLPFFAVGVYLTKVYCVWKSLLPFLFVSEVPEIP